MNCLVVSSVSCRTSPAVNWTRDNVVRVRSLMFVSSSLTMLLNGLLLLSNCCLNFRKLVLCDWLSSILSLHIRQDLPYVHGTHKRTELFGTVLVIQYRPVHMHTNIPATESGM